MKEMDNPLNSQCGLFLSYILIEDFFFPAALQLFF